MYLAYLANLEVSILGINNSCHNADALALTNAISDTRVITSAIASKLESFRTISLMPATFINALMSFNDSMLALCNTIRA